MSRSTAKSGAFPVVIRTAAREVRVAAQAQELPAVRLASNPTAFGADIAGRHGAAAPWVEPSSRELARPGARVVRRSSHFHAHVRFAPRLDLSVLRLAGPPGIALDRAERPSALLHWELIHPIQPAASGIVERVVRREIHQATQWIRTARELVTRAERYETRPTGQGHVTVRSPMQAELAPGRPVAERRDIEERATRVYRTIRNASEADGEPARNPRSAATNSGGTAQADALISGSAAPDPVQVDRIAEQVIRVIDRRIVAERERFGRA